MLLIKNPKNRRLLLDSLPRWMKSITHSVQVGQGGHLKFYLINVKFVDVSISSHWQDHVDIEMDGEEDNASPKTNISISEDHISNLCTISSDSDMLMAKIKVRVPELMDLSIIASGLRLEVSNKVRGDFKLKCDGGDGIVVDKLIGSNIEILAGSNAVVCKKSFEGNVTIYTSGSLFAKKIFGDKVLMDVGSADIESLHALRANLLSTGVVKLGSLNGHLKAEVEDGGITVGGIDGSFDLVAKRGNVTLQLNKLVDYSMSRALAESGELFLGAAPECQADVVCVSERVGKSEVFPRVNVASDAFVCLEQDIDGVFASTAATIARNNNSGSCRDVSSSESPSVGLFVSSDGLTATRRVSLAGFFTGASMRETHASVPRAGSNSSGKINLAAAQAQSLANIVSAESPSQGNHGMTTSCSVSVVNSKEREDEVTIGSAPTSKTPCLNLYARGGSVTIETVSWMEAIRRKYGLGNNE